MKPIHVYLKKENGADDIIVYSFPLENEVAPIDTPALKLFDRYDYFLSIVFSLPLAKYQKGFFKVILNGTPIRFSLSAHNRELILRFDSPLFIQCLRFAELILEYEESGLIQKFELRAEIVETEYGRNDVGRNNLKLIENYVRDYGAFFLKNSAVKRFFDISGGGGNFFLSRRYKEVAHLYSRNISYFRNNARFKLSSKEVVAPFNRARYVASSSIHYIVSHPYELEVATEGRGIKIEKNFFTPAHTLVQSKVKNFDLYENKLVLGFLNEVCLSAEKDLSVSEPELKSRLITLLKVYETNLGFKSAPIKVLARPTPLINSVDVYRSFYMEMLRWYSLKEEREAIDAFVCNATTKGRLFEYYCLLKKLSNLIKEGWEFFGSSTIDWNFKSDFYHKPNFPNVFSFRRGVEKLEMFFEPVIFSLDQDKCRKIGLYRSSPINLNSSDMTTSLSPKLEKVYTPDYVIKKTKADGHRVFYIEDAKYTDIETTIHFRMLPFLFKYGFGISPVDGNDKVAKLTLICGFGQQKILNLANPNPDSGNCDIRVDVEVLNEN